MVLILAAVAGRIAYLRSTQSVPLLRLIASPIWNHENRVSTIGFVNIEFESNAAYIHHDFYTGRMPANGVWLELPDEVQQNPAAYNHRYILIEGTFSAWDTGHLGLFSGSISRITRFEPWPWSPKIEIDELAKED